ncbi:helix-turn-helix domain-containing protein [Deinococcus sp. QL22]|uniref:helix-turn-helix domain-containing protein n=1 Tax=Deinococcus sp. QL22 TaxID=2939437 RepID=UPI002017423B|nr:helix-turn-helix domain-containing protein [Deinococcus sp. QL22]UQN08199.1 helix-turn-helix domain-containing protein [Deinococcus sp. QL22]
MWNTGQVEMMNALPLVPHHTTGELWTHERSCRCAVEQRRTQAIALLSEGFSPHEIQRLTRLSAPVYANVVHAYNQHGLAGLRDRRQHNRGRPPRLSDQQLELLMQTIRHDQDQGILWNAPKVQAYAADVLGEQLHRRRCYELLEVMGLPWPVPQPASEQAAPKAPYEVKKYALLKRLERVSEALKCRVTV